MFLPKIFDLGNAFKQYFEIVPAYSEALKDEVYRVRHQVYCEDLKFEPMRPDGREIDEHDACSLHLLIRNVNTHEFIGCTRIVRTDPENRQHSLPFEIACTNALDLSIVDPTKLPRQSIAEVSRLAVISRYRRRKGEATKTVGISDEDFGTPDLPRFPYIPIGLYIGTIELARLNGIDTLFVLTEERQAAHFGKLGVKIQTIGSPVEHHGQRIPSMMSISGIINNMRRMFRSLYRTIAADIEAGTP
ncbi:PEP-CTERM/exosortase system-associated acyltransferase [Nitrosospira sp. Nsp13]|jgi:N-acyl amino acid synthase of PEP-CTERM/exosortase system|uniref:PEP-CTERM/exosortase system-associated acyltransferase n=1 Tax=Nitrosospira sp. Nsp13 TaxID=1855332 RepID=UPI00087EDE81|nr:PEP-CTERM/exosortase system-associated acyltransferase [Nitrosospira sp. Nsp13]SCY09787.1 N-acyl amino acid synthase, PEP-CTERM/exosortase system-associated [Nitrosospira sp. Nsp13]